MTTNNLAGLARSNAYIRSKQFSKAANFKKLGQELSEDIRLWLITGEGTPYAEVEPCDVKQALTCIEDTSKLSIDDNRLYFKYLYSLN